MTQTHREFFGPLPADVRLLASLAPQSICGCSSCKVVYDRAARDAAEMLKTECPASLLQYALSLHSLANALVAATMHELQPELAVHQVMEGSIANLDDVQTKFSFFLASQVGNTQDTAEVLGKAYLKRVGA